MNTGRTVVVCAAIVASSMAVAQNAPHHNYRITDLGDFDLESGDIHNLIAHSFGLNDLGQVVGEAKTIDDALHAFMWLPADAYGLTRFTLHDLGPGPGELDESRANDINEQGFAAGARQFNNAPEFRAFLWNPTLFTLASHDPQRISDLQVLTAEALVCPPAGQTPCNPSTAGFSSEAFAVNDAIAIPQTAGHSETAINCSILPLALRSRGYNDAVPGSDNHLDVNLKPNVLPVTDIKSLSQARSLNSANLVVGFALNTDEIEGAQSVPVFWDQFDPLADECVVAQPFQDFVDGLGPASARDINDTGNVVGFGCLQTGGFNLCGIELPLYWPSRSVDRNTLPPPAGLTESTPMKAVAISNRE